MAFVKTHTFFQVLRPWSDSDFQEWGLSISSCFFCLAERSEYNRKNLKMKKKASTTFGIIEGLHSWTGHHEDPKPVSSLFFQFSPLPLQLYFPGIQTHCIHQNVFCISGYLQPGECIWLLFLLPCLVSSDSRESVHTVLSEQGQCGAWAAKLLEIHFSPPAFQDYPRAVMSFSVTQTWTGRCSLWGREKPRNCLEHQCPSRIAQLAEIMHTLLSSQDKDCMCKEYFAFAVFNLGFHSCCVCCSLFLLEETSQCNGLCFQSWDLSWCSIPGGHSHPLGAFHPCGGMFHSAWGQVVSAVIFMEGFSVMSSLKAVEGVSFSRWSLDTSKAWWCRAISVVRKPWKYLVFLKNLSLT